MTAAAPSFEPLRTRVAGRVVTRDDDGWDAARMGFNLTVDPHPAVVVLPETAADVAEIVRFAAANGLRVAPQGTGHNGAPLPALDDVVLLRTSALGGVELDVAGRRVRAGAGAAWREVVEPASAAGVAALHGSAPGVSIAGYTLGGGIGWYARRHGLASNRVTEIELVTASGEQVVASAEREPDLFWALRGGGANVGVVTALEFELLPIPEVHGGALFFPWERAGEVLHAWSAFAEQAPEEVTSLGRLMQFPPFPQIPDPLRGRAFAIVEAVSLLDAGATAEQLAPLRALGPVMDTVATVPPAGIADLHMDPPEPVPGHSTHRLLDGFGDAAVDALLAAAGPDSGTSLLSTEVRQLGGALSRAPEGAGALATLPGAFCAFAVGMAAGPAAAALDGDLARLDDALAPYDAGRYLNFVEQPATLADVVDADTHRRLAAIRERVDPDGVLLANVPVGEPAGA